MKKRNLFTNIDVFAISRELDEILANGTIANIYSVEDLLLLRINTAQEGRKNLIIKSDSRINLTDYNYPIPKYPSQYILSLRKHLRNRKILSVSQYNFDRIVIIELSNLNTEPWKFVIELFNKGNFLLLDEKNVIKIAKKYKKFKDRDVLAGKEYIFPLLRGKDFLSIGPEEFKDLVITSNIEIVRNLARNINIAGLYSEEVCYKAGIDKQSIGKDLSEEDIDKLYKAFKKVRNQLLFGDINAQIVIDDTGTEVSVVPFDIEMFKKYKKRIFKSFNSAVDEFFSKIDSKIIKKPSDEKIKAKIKAQEKILKNQMEYMEELKAKKKKYYNCGEFVYANFKTLEDMLNVIINAQSKGYGWEEINEKLNFAKLENLKGSEFFKKIIPSTKQLVIKFNDDEIYLDLNKSLGENGNNIYSKGKKADKKIKGTTLAIEKTKNNIQKLKLEKDSIEAEIDFLIKKPKKNWFEKFRWFISSDGYLVIGGRDASSNEVIFKKYSNPNDLVFHTNFAGSPLTILKNAENDKKIPDRTLSETADFVASYSRAWKETWGVVDVFYIMPEQVSKSPPSGEYLPKGSFVISGKKNFIKNAKTELAIGLELVEMDTGSNAEIKIFYPKLLSGPKNAITTKTQNIVTIIPSKTGLSKGALAKQIKQYFLKNSDNKMKKWIKLLSIDEIILYLPNGSSVIK